MKSYDPTQKPFAVCGLPFFYTEKLYRRLSNVPPMPLPSSVNGLSNCPAGGQIRFRAVFRELGVKVTLHNPTYMAHMPPTGHSGVDCYLKVEGVDSEPRYHITAFPPNGAKEYSSTLISIPNAVDAEITLNLPLYNSVAAVEIELDDDAVVSEAKPFIPGKVVVYGGSIDQGGCANRPGMAYTNILSRWLDREFVNLGFSGSGKAEEEVALAVRDIDDVSLFVINTAGNCPDADWLYEKMPRFIEVIREKYPTTPILIWQLADFFKSRFNDPVQANFNAKLRVEERVYSERKAAGDENIYIDRMDFTESFMGHDLTAEGTVDGVHPSDLGFMQTAKKLYPILKRLLGEDQ